MSITSSNIPPWQREGDDYDGSVTVNISNTTSNSWHLEADVYDFNNVQLGNVVFPSINSNTYTFNTAIFILLANAQLKSLSLAGRTIKYKAKFDGNSTIESNVSSITKIIEKKWDKKNVIYWRDPSSTDVLRIPIKWSGVSADQAVYIKIKRFNQSSWVLPSPLSNTQGDDYNSEFYENYPSGGRFHIGKYPVTLKNSSGLNIFSIDPTSGYCVIQASNSNIYSELLFPGDFAFEVYNNQGSVIEKGYFDLTKIGRIKGVPTSKKIIVVVGGILNEAEISSGLLRANDGTGANSDLSYSVSEYVRNLIPAYSTWYIAQGNSNSVSRNGYDIGLG